MRRRSFLQGLFAGAALAALPKLQASAKGTTAVSAAVPRQWTVMLYGTPILFMPKKAVHFISLETTIEGVELPL